MFTPFLNEPSLVVVADSVGWKIDVYCCCGYFNAAVIFRPFSHNTQQQIVVTRIVLLISTTISPSSTGSSVATRNSMSPMKKRAFFLCLLMCLLAIAISITLWAALKYRETRLLILVLALQIVMSMFVGALGEFDLANGFRIAY